MLTHSNPAGRGLAEGRGGIALYSATTARASEAFRTKVEPRLAQCIQPLEDPRWDSFVQAHPQASVFHSSEWLRSLSRTYGYEPIAFTTTRAGEDLRNAMVFCRVESWLTGRRLVSLPFSDHCEPLLDREDELEVLTAALEQECRRERWRYLELRPLTPFAITTELHHTAVPYTFHQLDLDPDLDTLFLNCHKSSTQRKIRRAEREGLTCAEGSSVELLNHFYKLFVVTRKRHNLPPPPRVWFANLVESFGSALTIRVVYRQGTPIAAMITIRHKETLVYKYGCSDARFHNMGSMHLLYWKAIEDAKACGLRHFDLGRTDADQQGLITFKSRWGATQSVVTYSRYSLSAEAAHVFDLSAAKWKSRIAKSLLSNLPLDALSFIGKNFYRHIG